MWSASCSHLVRGGAATPLVKKRKAVRRRRADRARRLIGGCVSVKAGPGDFPDTCLQSSDMTVVERARRWPSGTRDRPSGALPHGRRTRARPLPPRLLALSRLSASCRSVLRDGEGSAQRISVVSAALGGRSQEVLVYLPPGYRTHPHRRYPVFYLLHGVPGVPTAFLLTVRAGVVEDELVARHEARPMILVMPMGSTGQFTDKEWVNGVRPHEGWSTFVWRDVVHAIDTRYRTIRDGSGRAIGGLSEGGYGAIDIALQHPREFRVVESWSGYQLADPLPSIFGQDQALSPRTRRCCRCAATPRRCGARTTTSGSTPARPIRSRSRTHSSRSCWRGCGFLRYRELPAATTGRCGGIRRRCRCSLRRRGSACVGARAPSGALPSSRR